MNSVSEINNKKQELLKQIEILDKDVEILNEQERRRKIELNEEKLNWFRENKELLMPLFNHDRDDCSDDNPRNDGLNRHGNPDCKKCFLISILDESWNNDYEVVVDLNFYKI